MCPNLDGFPAVKLAKTMFVCCQTRSLVLLAISALLFYFGLGSFFWPNTYSHIFPHDFHYQKNPHIFFPLISKGFCHKKPALWGPVTPNWWSWTKRWTWSKDRPKVGYQFFHQSVSFSTTSAVLHRFLRHHCWNHRQQLHPPVWPWDVAARCLRPRRRQRLGEEQRLGDSPGPSLRCWPEFIATAGWLTLKSFGMRNSAEMFRTHLKFTFWVFHSARNTVVPMKSKKGQIVANRCIRLSMPEPGCTSYPGILPKVCDNLRDGEPLLPLMKRRKLGWWKGVANEKRCQFKQNLKLKPLVKLEQLTTPKWNL